MTCLGCKYARLCIMYEPRMKACKDYEKEIIERKNKIKALSESSDFAAIQGIIDICNNSFFDNTYPELFT